MTMLKKIALIMILFGGILGAVSCSNISLGDTGGGYPVVVTNGTGGVLASVAIDETICTDLQPDAACTATYHARPETFDVTYVGKQANGFGETDLGSKVTYATVAASDSHAETLSLHSDYVAVWVENVSETIDQNIDLVGIGTAYNSLTKAALYGGITNDEIEFGDVASAVSGVIDTPGGSNIEFYATVTGEQLTHDVTAEDIADNILDNNETNDPVAMIIKKSVTLTGVSSGLGTVIATDDGDGNLTPVGGLIEAGGTINYKSGAVSYTLTGGPYDSVEASYKYITYHGYVPANVPAEGSIVIKMGATIIAQEVYDTDNEKYKLSGTDVKASMSEYDYVNDKLYLLLQDDMYTTDRITDDLVIEYSYKIGADNDAGTAEVETGSIEGAGFETDTTNYIINYATGEYTFKIDTTAFENVINGYNHTITGLYANYHFPYAQAIVDNIGDATALAANENIAFTAETRTATAYLANRLITTGTVSITAQFDDGAGSPVDVTIVDNVADGILSDSADSSTVGSIDYDSGKITLTVPDAGASAGFTMTGLWASAYTYQVAASSNKAWAGFVKKSDLSGSNGIYVLDMSTPSTVDGHWAFPDVDYLYDTNESGSTVLNLICGLQYQ